MARAVAIRVRLVASAGERARSWCAERATHPRSIVLSQTLSAPADIPSDLLWQPDDGDQSLFDSAVALAQFAVTDPRVHERQQKRLLDEAIWFVSERGSVANKFRIRYRSVESVALQAALRQRSAWSRHLRHDHVLPRKVLIARMQESGADCAAVLADVTACVVTKEEHARLSPHALLDGWARYAAAGIDVLDMADGSLLPETQPSGTDRAR